MLVAAVSADKDVAGIAAALAPAVRAVIATRYRQERALPPAELAATFRRAGGGVGGAGEDGGGGAGGAGGGGARRRPHRRGQRSPR